MSEVEQELRKYKDSLRKVLEEMCNSAMTRYDLTSELGIYGQLLTYEETRMTTHSSEHRVTVRDTQTRRSHSASVLAADMETSPSSSSSSSSSHVRRESGYFS